MKWKSDAHACTLNIIWYTHTIIHEIHARTIHTYMYIVHITCIIHLCIIIYTCIYNTYMYICIAHTVHPLYCNKIAINT